jgi:hypothetical protein
MVDRGRSIGTLGMRQKCYLKAGTLSDLSGLYVLTLCLCLAYNSHGLFDKQLHCTRASCFRDGSRPI